MLAIYLADTDISEEKYKRIYDMLPDYRRQTADKRKSEEARRETVLSFYLLMRGLKENGLVARYSELGSWTYSAGEQGKPYFGNREEIHFSISHTKGKVMCAISDEEVGCDVEKKKKTRDDAIKLADRFFMTEESSKIAALQGKESVDEFYRIWTGKESVVKKSGLGMAQPFDSFSVYECKPEPVVVWENRDYTASVCASENDYSVEEINLECEEFVNEKQA